MAIPSLNISSPSFASPKKPQFGRGLDGFYPYYAGFSEKFTRSIFEGLKLTENAKILDPWNGSGTTTAVSFDLGFTSFGGDLNPVATVISLAKTARFVSPNAIREILSQIVCLAKKLGIEKFRNDPLSCWCSKKALLAIRGLQNSIRSVFESNIPSIDQGQFRSQSAFFLSTLFLTLRNLFLARKTGNPTWVRAWKDESIGYDDVFSEFIRVVELRIQESDFLFSNPRGVYFPIVSDAKKLPFSSSSFDLIFTSPPYCTRIDYAVSLSIELSLLLGENYSKDFGLLRKSLMGTTQIRGYQSYAINHWSKLTQEIFNSISSHQTSNKTKYYFRNYYQYFEDAHNSIREISRVLAKGGSLVMVVQGSYFHEIEIDLAKLYLDIGNLFGLSGSVILSIPVYSFFSRIHKTASHKGRTRKYREDVILFRK